MSAGEARAASSPVAPSVGRLLAPLLGELADSERPGFLARLERAAAERYRAWALAAPQHASSLLACAQSENAIADRADRLFPTSAAQAGRIDALMPRARALYEAALAGLPLREQLALQAAAEREGASAWRAFADSNGLPHALRESLRSCAVLEEESAQRLEKLLADWRA